MNRTAFNCIMSLIVLRVHNSKAAVLPIPNLLTFHAGVIKATLPKLFFFNKDITELYYLRTQKFVILLAAGLLNRKVHRSSIPVLLKHFFGVSARYHASHCGSD